MAKGDSLADQLFNRDSVGRLAGHFEEAGVFAAAPFVADVMTDLHQLELKARINHIAAHLETYLPRDFSLADAAIRASLPPALDPNLNDNDFGAFIYAPLGVFVENQGLANHFDASMSLLMTLTQRFSMEFSLRAFLNANQNASLAYIRHWAGHDNYHVRRLASEGTRPRLPWGHKVGLTPDDTLPILDMLYSDPTRFVTRSVANHLNDIAKFAPDAVVDRLKYWAKDAKQDPDELDWMTRHALRSLVKTGHAEALQLLGYQTDATFSQADISLAPVIAMNSKVKFNATLTPTADGPLMIDYVIDFAKASRKSSAKVFKIKRLNGKAHQKIDLSKSHHFDGTATTFRLHAGDHKIHLQVNGQIVASRAFVLR
tara:strand:- start:1988 stop:3103 length:1116 start_codon:yes stop_codon:yes gene_type:complete